jgi:DNA-binding response OmpR family regulator
MSNTMHKKIMIADDDPGILDALKIILEDEGYDVSVTVNGETLLKMKKEFPDLLLLDIWMSGMDGRDICKRLKKQQLTKDIPIMMISANKDVKDISLACGADDFLSKPFDIDDLLEKIKKLLNKK